MSKSLLVALLALLSACASSSAYEYSGATPAAPVYTPAGAGAPVRGQPGDRVSDREVPRGRDKRILPPEERPGIWASDSAGKTRTVTERLTEPPPAPKGLPEAAWAACWGDVQTCLLADPRAVRASDAEYGCLRERIVAACGGMRSDRGAIGRPDTLAKYGRGYYNPGDFYDAMQPRKAKACKGVDQRSDAFMLLYEHLYARCHRIWLDTP